MEKPLYRILSYLGIIVFLLYWLSLFILAMPSNYARTALLNYAPRFNSVFGTTWRLFTPPHSYNNRLYYIVRDIERPSESDTIEVLENIALQKQRHAPFNQKENIIDHMVNNSVAGLKRTVWPNQKMPDDAVPSAPDSLQIARAIAGVVNKEDYGNYLATINNYCAVVLNDKKIDLSGKEVKILIKEKLTRPFNQMGKTPYWQKEILVFETPYKAFVK
jgi:hypothetical protein